MNAKKNPVATNAPNPTPPRTAEQEANGTTRTREADSLEGAQATDERSPLRREPPPRTYPNTKGRQPLPSTTREDIERADGEGMAPVPPPRPHTPKPREEKSSHEY
ncbi:MAG: hypothetical protein U0174_07290 [Polyangiaceae bacterium]